MKKKIYLYSIIAIVVIGTAGYFLFFNSGSEDITYRTEKITRGDVIVQVRATGTINPVRTVLVGAQVSGIIEKIYVDFNSVVHMGQPIAQIDSTFLYASVKEAEANLERNQAQLNEAQRNLNRTKELFKKDLVSQADLDAAQTSFEAAAAQLKQSQGAVERAMVNLRYAVIRAPINGIVISRDVDVGQTVASSFQTPKMFTIAQDLKNMQVEASVDEADIVQISIGQEVTFTVDAYPQQEFEGKVTQIRLAPVTVQNVVTYTVIISVNNDAMKLRPGMTATATILVDKRENTLRVPMLATRFQPPDEVLQKINEKQDTKNGDEQIAGLKDESREIKKDSLKDAETKFPQGSDQRRMFREGGKSSDREFRKDRASLMRSRGENPDRDYRSQAPEKVVLKMSRIWILVGGKEPKSIIICTGISDSRWVELVGEQLKEGDEVIVGTIGGNNVASDQQQVNPFGPQRMMIMGGGGSGRR
ncbi:MAG: efflux RND transporter periplasmic adaptor subunit [Ignavibacteriales bacterium]|nr:efflux RND transporter periplasmic adaptor subunit [Ignavibacteriales bacterium]